MNITVTLKAYEGQSGKIYTIDSNLFMFSIGSDNRFTLMREFKKSFRSQLEWFRGGQNEKP
jgi:hypothetical protein